MKRNWIILIAAILLLLTACSGGKATPSATVEPSPSSTVKIAAPPVIVANEEKQEYKAEDGKIVLTEKCSLPKIQNADESTAYTAINEYYASEMQMQFDCANSEELQYAKDDYAYAIEEDREFLGYSNEQSFEQTCLSDKMVSFYRTQYSYTGGVHGNAAVIGDTFDLSNGARLSMDELFSVPEAEYTSRILAEVMSQIETINQQEEQRFYEDYETVVPDAFQKENFYMTDTSLVVFFQPYMIAPWAAGIPTFEIFFEQLEDIIKV